MRRILPLGIAVAAALTLGPGVARACSCDGFGLVLLWPEMDASDVPLNTRIWVGRTFDIAAGLQSPRLRPVGVEPSVGFSTSVIATGTGPLEVLTPEQPLAPNTTYELVECQTTICDDVIARFTTGAITDVEPPPLPSETDREGGADRRGRSSCGKTAWVTLDVAAEGLLVIDIDGGSLDPKTLEGNTSVVTFDRSVTIGHGGCLTGWPDPADNAAPVRYGAFDVAGNFSGWTEPDALMLGGCNCRSDAPAGRSLLGLALLGLALHRRRRRR